MVGPYICNYVISVFTHQTWDASINKTILTLIPKVKNPSIMTQFRSISLCTVLYKTFTKVIVSQSKPFLNGLVCPTQCSFIPGSHITNNIVIAQEVIHSMKNKTWKKVFLTIKVDLEKTYDRLRWDFILDTLINIGIHYSLISLIMKCATTSSIQVAWQGTFLESYNPFRGLRQGDPLSPYLFVVCMELLSHLINNK